MKRPETDLIKDGDMNIVLFPDSKWFEYLKWLEANQLPPLKIDCPECKTEGWVGTGSPCENCGGYTDEKGNDYGGSGQVWNYLTPEQWEEQTGKKLLDSDPVWYCGNDNNWHKGDDVVDVEYCKMLHIPCVVHIVGQPAPPDNYIYIEKELQG